MKKKVHIFGAGFSGLSLACELVNHPQLKNNIEIIIYEKSNRVGGLIASDQYSSHDDSQEGHEHQLYVEKAANGLRATNSVRSFFDRYDVKYKLSEKISQKRFIYRFNKFTKWPLTFFETLYFIFKLIFSVLTLKLKPLSERESLYDYSNRVIGTTATNYLTDAAFSGIYATQSRFLNVYLVLKVFFKKNELFKNNFYLEFKKSQRPMHNYSDKAALLSGVNGTEDLITQMAKHVKNQGVQFKFEVPNTEEIILNLLNENQNYKNIVVLATSAVDARQITEKILESQSLNAQSSEVQKEISQAHKFLNQIAMTPVLSLNVISQQLPDAKKQGFGVLFPQCDQHLAMGLLFNDLVFGRKFKLANGKSAYTEKWILGESEITSLRLYSSQQELLEKSDLLLRFKKMRYEVLGLDESTIIDIVIQFWPEALPVYSSEHLQNVKNYQVGSQYILHGNYFSDIGLSKIIDLSQKQAEHIASL